jgi:TatD DNase family protein
MLIDTHCHLDAAAFDADREVVARSARLQGVSAIVVPAVERGNFDAVIALHQKHAHCAYALGIHPMYVHSACEQDLNVLAQYVRDNSPVAIGEIGLDYFVTNPKAHPENIQRQHDFFDAQLDIAQQHGLPVILHVRGAIDHILKALRKRHLTGGIAHAFNGSLQQAKQFIDLGFKLGFGGAMTYSRALHLRALAKTLPLEAIVLETDAPDISPEWVGKSARNSPEVLPKIAQFLAELRQENIGQVLDITGANALKVLPKLAHLFTPVKVLH